MFEILRTNWKLTDAHRTSLLKEASVLAIITWLRICGRSTGSGNLVIPSFLTPRIAGDRSGGDGALAPVLARAAAAAGCDGIFIETHYDPSQALSDGPNQVPLRDLSPLLAKLSQIHA